MTESCCICRCTKCLLYIQDRLCQPLHATNHLRDYIHGKRLQKHAWKIASFYTYHVAAYNDHGRMRSFQLCLELAKMVIHARYAGTLYSRNERDVYIESHEDECLEEFYYEYTALFPEVGVEFDYLVMHLCEWGILKGGGKTGLLWFVEWLIAFLHELPEVHRGHSGSGNCIMVCCKHTKSVEDRHNKRSTFHALCNKACEKRLCTITDTNEEYIADTPLRYGAVSMEDMYA